MKRFAVILALALLAALGGTGCETMSPYVAAAKEKGAQAMDEALVEAEWTICQAASTGAVDRRYGQTPDLWRARQTICRRPSPDWVPATQ